MDGDGPLLMVLECKDLRSFDLSVISDVITSATSDASASAAEAAAAE